MKFYTPKNLVKCYEFFSANREVLYNFTQTNTPGVPDGMTIDNEGMIWVTAFNGHQVGRIRRAK